MSEWKNGLPPVGEVCEIEYSADLWVTGECVAHHRDGAVIEYKERYSHCFADRVRTLKSEAELKREKAVEEMFSAITYDELATFEWSAHAERICKCLHDAGYRKVSELTDDQMHEHINKLSPSSNRHYRLSMFEAMLWAKSQIMGEES